VSRSRRDFVLAMRAASRACDAGLAGAVCVRWRVAIVLPACLGLLVACSTPPDAGRARTAGEPIASALRTGGCSGAYEQLMAMADRAPADRVSIGSACLQSGDFERARQLTAPLVALPADEPHGDYGHYIHVLAGFGSWSRASAAAPAVRLEEGRRVFTEIVDYRRMRPLAEYGDDLLPRLVGLREGIARAELDLARQDLDHGRDEAARLRVEYLMTHFPQTEATLAAAQLLMAAGPRVPARAAAASAGAAPPAGLAGEQPRRAILDERWLRERDGARFTVQLAAGRDPERMRALAEGLGGGDPVALVRIARADGQWTLLVSGDHADLAAARAAIGRLPGELRGDRPWPRSFGSIKRLLAE
jgi:septal ring-binding cell division protein DamX